MIDGAISCNRPTFADNLFRALGFVWRVDVDEQMDWSDRTGNKVLPHPMSSHVFVKLSWLDRVRMLVSGKMEIEIRTKTDTYINYAESRSWVRIAPPHERM